ncbi:MAG: murein biosynthesis integral membrane protein MurJ [Candidatus Cloacimonadaceae bacterium]|nr:murein biosynthesis integral membrane protein MurJ [Candidatus Cloacimonadaceae bacterium]MDP3114206.1 murein biosynthesis integral membrane protein MurJ [Candidatus Cloacimonadaceae bacterium]
MSQKKLLRNIGMMSSAVFISRIVGLLRDTVMAYFFGTTYLNDAFIVAYKIPNLLRGLFGEGALSAAFVPLYNEIGIKRGREDQYRFALQVLSILSLALMILTFFGVILAPWIVRILYPGLAEHTKVLAVSLSRIMFPYLFLIGLSSTMIAILNSHDYFFMTGLSSALLNIGMIATILIPYALGVRGEALVYWAGWGVFFGGILQTAINFPFLKRIGYRFAARIKFSGEAITALWRRFLPSMIGVGIREINILADSLMASFLVVGSITALEYGNRLVHLPMGIFAISTGMALLPLYSRNVTEKKFEELSQSMRFSAITLAYVMIPVTMLIFALGGDFVYLLFQRGAFDARASLMTQQALFFYSIGLLFYSLNQTITPLFYANKDTRTPVKIAAAMVTLNITLNFILMQFMQHRGLALSTSITAATNYCVLLYHIRKKLPQIDFSGIWTNILKAIVICAVIYIPIALQGRYIVVSGKGMVLLRDVIVTSVSFLLFYLLGLLFNLAYLKESTKRVWNRFTGR